MENKKKNKNSEELNLINDLQQITKVDSPALQNFLQIIKKFLEADDIPSIKLKNKKQSSGFEDKLLFTRKIEFVSLCKDTLLPFFGHLKIQYEIKNHFIGLNTLKTIVKEETRKLTFQEELGKNLKKRILEILGESEKFSITISAYHLCSLLSNSSIKEAKIKTIYQN